MDKLVELHFIDGPLAGTRMMEQESIIQRNRTYRYLLPTNNTPEQKVPTNTNLKAVQVVCTEWHYLPFRLPGTYKTGRYAMCLEEGLS